MHNAPLWVDGRYQGNHGIARYAREVVSRIPPHRALPVGGSPTSPLGLMRLGWLKPAAQDLIYSPGFGTGVSRARQLLTLHDLIHLETGAGAKNRAVASYYEGPVKAAVRRTGHILTVSETSKTKLRAWLADDSIEIHVTGNGCSEAFHGTGERHVGQRPYLLYVGNFKQHKNVSVAFEAMSFLPDHDLLVVSGDVAGFNREASRFELGSRATLLSGVSDDELARYYRGADALVFPSLLEGFGLPVVEALRCGTPVVYAGVCESVAEICAGTQVAVDDAASPRAFARGVEQALLGTKTPDLRGYEWSSVAAEVTAVLARLAR